MYEEKYFQVCNFSTRSCSLTQERGRNILWMLSTRMFCGSAYPVSQGCWFVRWLSKWHGEVHRQNGNGGAWAMDGYEIRNRGDSEYWRLFIQTLTRWKASMGYRVFILSAQTVTSVIPGFISGSSSRRFRELPIRMQKIWTASKWGWISQVL